MLLTATSPLESIARFVTVLLIFVFVLAITYFTTRFIGGYQKQKMRTGNMEVLDTMRLTQNKYLQIIRAGEKYLLIAVCKDSVTMLCELEKDELADNLSENMQQIPDFQSILDKVKKFSKQEPKEKKQADEDE
jgi:flagellar protein FliO/FliZ